MGLVNLADRRAPPDLIWSAEIKHISERFATMSNIFTLDELNSQIEKKYAPLVFQADGQEFTLVSLMRVDKKVRKDVQDKLESLQDSADDEKTVDEDDTIQVLRFVLSSVTKDNKGRALIKVLGDDIVKYTTLLERWQEATQPGEASSSQD